ncbi:MAG: DUF3450 domain-containing protein [Bdellovibrionales bacterium]|nr:DUF3450 domain-containing protein [Bdellovibrionales bacterium]
MLFQTKIFFFLFSFLLSIKISFADKTLEKLNQVKEITNQIHQESRNSQKKINQWDDETKQMLNQYRRALKKTESLKIYNEQLASYIESQQEEMLDIRRKIEQVKDTRQDIVPLMLKMLDALEQFINLDVPFLLTERKRRIYDLKQILRRSDVSVSEKYRQIISAYKLEQDYGRTLQTYRELRKMEEGKELTVNYLRLGRLAFIYISLDGRYMGYWDKKTKQWKKLPKSYKKSILKAIKIAKKQVPPDLIKMPIFFPANLLSKS